MYTSTSAPLPPNSQAPPSAADVARYKNNLATLARSIDKARTSWMCSWQAALSAQPVPTQIPGLLPVSSVAPPKSVVTRAQVEAADDRKANALAMPNLTAEEREAIASAPKV